MLSEELSDFLHPLSDRHQDLLRVLVMVGVLYKHGAQASCWYKDFISFGCIPGQLEKLQIS